MATTQSPIMDVSERDFATAVVQRSREVPVVVDFWAPWCGPCRVLGPVLERLATENGGAFVLAKVNVDQNQRLAAQFGVQGIPAVKAFRDGKVVAEFTGALPEREVRAWLKNIVPSEADRLLAAARAQEQSDPTAAAATYRQMLRSDPQHAAALLGLGRLLTLQGDPEADTILSRIKPGTPEYQTAQALRELTPLLATTTDDLADSRERLGRNPNDTAARWAVAGQLARAHQWEDALRHLLAIVQRDRAFGDDAARRAILAIFALLGERDPLVAQYRRQLAGALF